MTLHEWADFQCGLSRRAETAVRALLKDYGIRVRLVWHDLPLREHADAALAAEAGPEAFAQKGDTAFWSLHDTIFSDQEHLQRRDLDLTPRRWGST